MRSADYTRLAEHLPPVYQDDATSFQHVDGYLGLVDDLNHALVERVGDVALTLGPDAALRWPSDVPLSAGSDALLERLNSDLDEAATWVSFAFPSSWKRAETGLAARRRFLEKSTMLWRRRGTPPGFVDWFSLYFGLEAADERPFLLEHFKVPGVKFDTRPYTATLFVPSTPGFSDYRSRREAAEFVEWYAPAHTSIRVCYVLTTMFADLEVFARLPSLPVAPTADEFTTYVGDLKAKIGQLNELLCSVVSIIDDDNAIHLYECGEPERTIDQLGVGKLLYDGD